MTPRDAVRLSWGAGLLLAPDRCARVLTGTTLDPRARLVVRALGVRHLAQGLAFSVHGTDPLRRAGRVVDLLHAGSMVLLAALAPGRERLTLTDAVIELALAEPAPRSTRSQVQAPHLQPTRADPGMGSDPGTGAATDPGDDRTPGADRDPERRPELVIESTDGSLTRRQHNALLQEAVYEAYLSTHGEHPDRVRPALLNALSARGVSPPPAAWLQAVVDEMASGILYVVSAPALDDIGVSAPGGKPQPHPDGTP